MLKGVFYELWSCIIATAILAGLVKFSYDVYIEVDRVQTPIGAMQHVAAEAANEVGLIRQNPYRRAVNSCAREIAKEITERNEPNR